MSSEPVKISSKAAARVQELLDGLQKLNEQISVYVQGLGAGMDVPDGWQLDPRAMAFVPPPAPAPVEPEPGGEGTADAA